MASTPDVARQLGREAVPGWITEDVTAALADVADDKLTGTAP